MMRTHMHTRRARAHAEYDLTQLLLVRRLLERRYVDDCPGIDGQTTGLPAGRA